MNRILISVGLVLAFAAASEAQTVVPNPVPPTTMLEFNHDGIDTDGYWLYVDGVKQTPALVVTPSTPPAFRAPFPPLTRGVHNLEVTAFNAAGESPKSNTLAVRVIVIPTSPTSLHLQIVEDGTLLMHEQRLRDGE